MADDSVSDAPRELPAGFAIGAVLGQSLRLLGRNLGALLGIAALVALPLLVVLFILVAVLSETGAGQAFEDFDPTAGGIGGGIAVLLGALIAVGGYYVATAAITLRIARAIEGERIGVLACLGAALRAAPRLLGAGLLMLLAYGVLAGAVGFAFWNAFDPGLAAPQVGIGAAIAILAACALAYLALSVLWLVAIPASILERAGPIACLARSRALTKGRRWRIAGLLLLIMLAQGGVQALLSGLLRLGDAGDSIGNVLGIFFYLLGTALAAVAWHRLRAEKEGDRVAGVFD